MIFGCVSANEASIRNFKDNFERSDQDKLSAVVINHLANAACLTTPRPCIFACLTTPCLKILSA